LRDAHPPSPVCDARMRIDHLCARRPPALLAPRERLGRGAPPAALLSVARRAMDPEPADRYPTAAPLAEELRRYQNGQRVLAHRYTGRELAGRWLSRRLALLVAAAVTLALVAAAAVVGGLRVARERN